MWKYVSDKLGTETVLNIRPKPYLYFLNFILLYELIGSALPDNAIQFL